MNNSNNDLLPLWYKEGDYPLFPIRQADADMLLFNIVWDVAVSSGYLDFVRSVTIRNFNPINSLKDISCLLIFPGDEATTKYTLPKLTMPYFVGIYGIDPPVFDDLDDDEYPSLYYCFCPEWAFDGSGEIIYNNEGGGGYDVPSFQNNGAELKQAICSLLDFLQQHPVEIGSWRERLSLSLQMLDAHANRFHILHNAGLYDIDALWTLLLDAGLAGRELLKVSTQMTHQLHRFAMLAVNTADK